MLEACLCKSPYVSSFASPNHEIVYIFRGGRGGSILVSAGPTICQHRVRRVFQFSLFFQAFSSGRGPSQAVELLDTVCRSSKELLRGSPQLCKFRSRSHGIKPQWPQLAPAFRPSPADFASKLPTSDQRVSEVLRFREVRIAESESCSATFWGLMRPAPAAPAAPAQHLSGKRSTK